MSSCRHPVLAGRAVPQFESLEGRRLLAGNVTIVGGANFTATITGDKKSNSIEISLFGRDGYLIRGLGGTKVNGTAEVLLRSSTAANLNISLGKGNDGISLVGPLYTQTVSILTGDGNDRVTIAQVSHFGDLKISTGKGKDSVTLSGIKVTQALAIDTGVDDDSIVFSAVQVDGNAEVNAGKGKNKLLGATELHATGAISILGIKATKPVDRSGDGEDDEHDDKDREHDD